MEELLRTYLEAKKPSTRRRVQRYITLYLQCHSSSATELLNEAWTDQRGDTPPWMHKLPRRIEEYKDYLEELDHSEITVKTAVTNIRSFYTAHGIHVPRQRLQYRKTDTVERVVQSTTDLPGRDEILRALGVCHPKYQAVIMTMATSGMDASTTLSLDVSDFISGLGDCAEVGVNGQLDIDGTRGNIDGGGDGVVDWRVSRRKLHREDKAIKYYHTYSTPEAVHSILSYLERYPPQSWGDSPLFRSTRRGKRLSTRALFDYFRKINNKCGWGRTGRLIYFRSHNLRKWFANQLASDGMTQRHIDYLMNHQVGGRVHQAYFKPDLEELRQAYILHMPCLSLLEEVKVRTVTTSDLEKMKDLEDRVRELEELKGAWELYNQLP